MQAPEPGEVRRALWRELESRGLQIASDSHGLRSELYVKGDGDLARALFEFKSSAAAACDTMYQGSWVGPPRFAVMPASEAESPEIPMLEQIRVIPLFFEMRDDGEIVFPALDALLSEHLSA